MQSQHRTSCAAPASQPSPRDVLATTPEPNKSLGGFRSPRMDAVPGFLAGEKPALVMQPGQVGRHREHPQPHP